jgi:hypothetical protein
MDLFTALRFLRFVIPFNSCNLVFLKSTGQLLSRETGFIPVALSGNKEWNP